MSYKIDGPTVISFSGGRTSGYMLYHVLEAHDFSLPKDTFVVFADTHKEFEQTYDFVRRCEAEWGTRIHWVDYPGGMSKIIEDRGKIPGPVSRFCTVEGKILPMMRFMVERGFSEWDNIVGIRYDEKRRVAKMRSVDKSKTQRPLRPPGMSAKEAKEKHPEKVWPRGAYDVCLPLAREKVTLEDVMGFWKEQPFDLQLRPDQSNCDLCYLKSVSSKIRLIAEEPERVKWWKEREERYGITFQKDLSYRSLELRADAARRQLSLPIFDPDEYEGISCGVCTD